MNSSFYQNGVFDIVRSRDVTDGLSKTYLVGEKAVPSDQYATGLARGDYSNWYTCQDGFVYGNDCWRATDGVPIRDPASGVTDYDYAGGPSPSNTFYYGAGLYGSAHTSTWNMVFCDGAVHSLSYNISLSTHQALSTRAAGDSPDPKEY